MQELFIVTGHRWSCASGDLTVDTFDISAHHLFMEWLHEPREWRQSDTGLVLRTDPKTDFWRITSDGQVRDNGHFSYEAVHGDCTISAHLEGDFVALYDQLGLMLRTDERNWLKCGIEYVHGEPFRSVVVTREFSDWSVVGNGARNSLWARIERHGSTVEVSLSEDGTRYALFRQTYFPEQSLIHVGLMAASPTGGGFEARFTELSLHRA